MSLSINTHQIRQLLEFTDNEDTELEIDWMPAGTFISGDPRPAGLYAWFKEYPDEGVILLEESPGSASGDA